MQWGSHTGGTFYHTSKHALHMHQGAHVLYNTCNGGPVLGVLFTVQGNMHCTCTGEHMHPGHTLGVHMHRHALHMHWGTHAPRTCITYPVLLCWTCFHEGFLATLIFCGVFYLCLYPSFCPCLCRVCLDLDACPCPCLSFVLYLCPESPCLDVCLYAGVVLYPCLFPCYLSHLEMLTYHLFQHQFCPRFPF